MINLISLIIEIACLMILSARAAREWNSPVSDGTSPWGTTIVWMLVIILLGLNIEHNFSGVF